MADQDALDTAKILKEAIKIVDELAKLYPYEDDDFNTLEELIGRATTLKKNKLWKLK